MKREAVHKQILTLDEEQFSNELRAEIAANPEYQSWLDQQRRLRGLLSLKNHEHPSETNLLHARQNIMRTVRQREPADAVGLWDLLTGPSIPALRYGTALLLVGLVAVQLMTQPAEESGSKAGLVELPTPQPEKAILASITNPAETTTHSAPQPLVLASNSEPGLLHYNSPLPPLRRVNYEY